MDFHSETNLDPLLALRKFPRYDTAFTNEESLSPTQSPALSPDNCPRNSESSGFDSDEGLQLILPPASLPLGEPRDAIREGSEGKLLGSLNPIEETDKEVLISNCDLTHAEHKQQCEKPKIHRPHHIPEPATYIFSPAFSTPGRKHTLLRRLFNKPDATTDVPEEIVIGRNAASGDMVAFNAEGLKKNGHEEDSEKSEQENEKEKEKDKEEVMGVIRLLHYPGSMISDHAVPTAPKPIQRTPSKAEQLMAKLFNLKHHSEDNHDKGRERERDSDGDKRSPKLSPTAHPNGYFLPVSVDSGDVISRTSSPAQAIGALFHKDSRKRSNSAARDDQSNGNKFKELLTSRHRRVGSAASQHGFAESELEEIASPQPATPTRTNSQKISRSHSETSMAEKYGRVSRTEVLGKGANAVVRLAHKTDTQCEVLYAVKEFRKRRKSESQRDYLKKVVGEFCISSNMRHENVIQTVDLIQDERERWCEVMEYMPGGDLYTLLASGSLNEPDEIACLFKQLMNGVAYLHSVGVAHRDLKPENLLLDAEARILKITDFGVAEVFRTCFEKSPRNAHGIRGSEPYIAPEEFDETPTGYDPAKTDIWACGIIFYTILHKSIPWRVAKAADPHYGRYLDFINKKGKERGGFGFPPFDRTPPGPRRLLYGLLDSDPVTRVGVSAVMEDEWFRNVEACKTGAPKHKHAAKDTNGG